jgi:hypothetical protein
MSLGKSNHLKDILDDVIIKYDFNEAIYCERIKKNMNFVFSSNLKNEIEILSLKSGLLLIKCDSSSWRYEINIRRNDFIDKINEFFGKTIVKSIEMV